MTQIEKENSGMREVRLRPKWVKPAARWSVFAFYSLDESGVDVERAEGGTSRQTPISGPVRYQYIPSPVLP